MIPAFLWLFNTLITLIIVVLIVNAVISWLIAFDIVSRGNRFVYTIWDFSQRLTRPLLDPIRRFVPLVGGIDLSPLILLLGLQFLRILVNDLVMRFFIDSAAYRLS